MAPLQRGQERHVVFDIRADYRLDENSFLAWNVKDHEQWNEDDLVALIEALAGEQHDTHNTPAK